MAFELVGGRWMQVARHLHVEADGWIRGHHVPTAIYMVKEKAQAADERPSDGTMFALLHAVQKLDVEINNYLQRMRELQAMVRDLEAALIDARANNLIEAPAVEPSLLDDHGVLLERMHALYDLERAEREDQR